MDTTQTLTSKQNISLKDIIKSEIKKCRLDPAYFMKKYCYIQHPERGKIPFSLYDFQENIVIPDLQKYKHNIILKSRQLGISTVVAGYCLWMVLFQRDKTIRIIATSQETSKNMITKINYMYYGLPRWLRTLTDNTEDNKLSLSFSNGSSVRALSSTPTSGRSESLSCLIFDECQFFDARITIKNKITGETKKIKIGELLQDDYS